jgi:hypothetical protein
MVEEPTVVKQCVSCPWRVDCVPDRDIPNYNPELHVGLRAKTIRSGLESLASCSVQMACHYSKPGKQFACAGWIHNQVGSGNNISVRLAVAHGRLPIPEVVGDQHEAFDDTLPEPRRPQRKRK